MKSLMTVLVAAMVAGTAAPLPVAAAPGVIQRACQQSDRDAATPQLCGCIQRVANHSLTRSERRKVAKWFSDPHQAQEVRMSDRRSDEELWKRYKAFGEKAHATCS